MNELRSKLHLFLVSGAACGILVPGTGIKPKPWQLRNTESWPPGKSSKLISWASYIHARGRFWFGIRCFSECYKKKKTPYIHSVSWCHFLLKINCLKNHYNFSPEIKIDKFYEVSRTVFFKTFQTCNIQ